MLLIKNLHAKAEGREILKGLDLELKAGEVHAVMGPNGSGKSTLAHILAGRGGYQVTAGSVSYLGKDLLRLAPEERAREGMFLAFQYPVEIPGVNNVYLLKEALNAVRKHRGELPLDAMDFLTLVKAKMQLMEMDQDFLGRAVNEGFSGGEKKRNEVLQMLVLEPKLALLDETDSGLDIDALKILCVIAYVVLGVLAFRLSRPRWLRMSLFFAAILLFAFIVSVAVLQDPRGIFALLG